MGNILLLNSFGLFPSYPPYSTSLLFNMLKQQGASVSVCDANLLLWEKLISPEFISERTYRRSNWEKTAIPLCPDINEKTFYALRDNAAACIESAKTVFRSKKEFYNTDRLLWACSILFQAQQVIYYDFGALCTNKVILWPGHGFNINSVSAINNLSEDRDHNLLFDLVEKFLMPEVTKANPTIVGIDFQFPWEIVIASTISKQIKQKFPHIHVNFTGFGFDEVCFARLHKRLGRDHRLFFGFDSIFLVRNNDALMQLYLQSDMAPERIKKIDSLAYLEQKTRLITVNGPFEESITSADSMPDYSPLSLESYYTPELVLLDKLSTKCYWSKCSYCNINTFKRHRLEISVDAFIQRILDYRDKYGCKKLFLLDEAATPALARDFSRAIQQNKIEVLWSLRTRNDPEFDRDLLQQMHAAGCRELWIGLETVSPPLLEKMRKTDNTTTYAQTASLLMKNCQDIGIGLHFCLIFGFPTETPEDLALLEKFFYENDEYVKALPFFLTFNMFNLNNGTAIYRDFKAYGVKAIVQNDDDFNMVGIPYEADNGNHSFNKEFEKHLDVVADRIIKIFVKKESMKLLWFMAGDSPWELLMKSGAPGRNVFLDKNTISDKAIMALLRLSEKHPLLLKTINFIANKKYGVVKTQLYH